MKYNVLQYSLRVWLTSVVVAPAFFVIITYCIPSTNYQNLSMTSMLDMYGFSVVFELILSSVIWLIFWGVIGLITWYFEEKTGTIIWLVFVSGMLLAIVPFVLLFPVTDPFFFEIAISNCACIAWGIWFYELKSK